MADIVNLRTVRKQRAKAERERDAAENRARFGKTRDEKVAERLSAELDQRRLDAHLRDVADDDDAK